MFVAAAFNSVGGPNDFLRNIVSGNLGDGIAIGGDNAAHNEVTNNYVGTDVDGLQAVPDGNPGPDSGERLASASVWEAPTLTA